MRNLKRVLALALALVMTLGLMVITGSAASYPDQDQISDDYSVAVDVLTDLGVFKGKGTSDGANFAPKEILDRGSAAALIYRVITGDVTDAKTVNYQYAVFSDMQDSDWDTGYVTYANNGGYIKGYDGRFSPRDPVTGTQALAIMLRALGYGKNGEFEGDGWEDRVLTLAHQQGLTAGIAYEATLRGGATRELISQLLFNALTQANMVTYNVVTRDYDDQKTTLGAKTFGLVDIDGVITGNEWADLNGDTPLAAGKTEIQNEAGAVVRYNMTSDITEIGQSVVGWAYGLTGTKTVAYYTDSGKNVIAETGEAQADSAAITKFAKDNGITSLKGAEKYINFGDEGAHKTSDFKIKYIVVYGTLDDAQADYDANTAAGVAARTHGITTGTNSAGATTYKYTREIAPGEVITATDLTNIKAIFDGADKYNGYIYEGEVYVGTQSETDISDDPNVSYNVFYNKYIDSEDNAVEINSTVNGDWLKIIDNDGDGVADYILKTEFFLDEITRIATNGKVSLYNNESTKTLDADEVALYDAEAGDVVLGTTIDGITHLKKADTKVATVSSVSFKNETVTTTDGETFGQSGIDNETGYAEVITAASEKVQYNMYFDGFGYLRAYDEVDGSTAFGLLTEAYTTNSYNNQVVKNTIGVVELTAGAEKTAEYTVNSFRTTNVFFQGTKYIDATRTSSAYFNLLTRATESLDTSYQAANSFAWGVKAHTLYTSSTQNTVYQDNSVTNVAKYTLSDDGVTLNTAAAQATNKAGAKLYYGTYADATDRTHKTTEAQWKADYIQATGATASAANTAWNSSAVVNQPVMGENYVQLAVNSISAGAKIYAQFGDNTHYVNAVHGTEYYLVRVDDNGNATTVSRYFTDYANVPAISSDKINAIYAVARNTTADSVGEDYWVADVIVIELNADLTNTHDSIALAYYNPDQTTGTVKNLLALDNKTSDPAVNLVPTSGYNWGTQWSTLGIYKVYGSTTDEDTITANNIDQVGSGYASVGVYAGQVHKNAVIANEGNYIDVNKTTAAANASNVTSVPVSNVPVYAITERTTTTNGIANTVVAATPITIDDVEKDHHIIWVMNGSTVAYIVDLDYEVVGSTTPTALQDLYDEIMEDQNPTPAKSLPDAIKDAEEVLDKVADGTYAADGDEVKEAISDLTKALAGATNVTAEQAAKVTELLAKLNGDTDDESGSTGTPAAVAQELVDAQAAYEALGEDATDEEKAAATDRLLTALAAYNALSKGDKAALTTDDKDLADKADEAAGKLTGDNADQDSPATATLAKVYSADDTDGTSTLIGLAKSLTGTTADASKQTLANYKAAYDLLDSLSPAELAYAKAALDADSTEDVPSSADVDAAVKAIQDLQNSTDEDQQNINAAVEAADKLLDLYTKVLEVAQPGDDDDDDLDLKAAEGKSDEFDAAMKDLTDAWDALSEDVQALFTDEALTALDELLESAPAATADEGDEDAETELPPATYTNAVKTAQANSPKAALTAAQNAAIEEITDAAQAANAVVEGNDNVVSQATLNDAVAAVKAATTEDGIKTAKDDQLKAIYNAVIAAVVKDLTDNGVELASDASVDSLDDVKTAIGTTLNGEASEDESDATPAASLTCTVGTVTKGAKTNTWTVDKIKVEYGTGTAQTATGVNVTVAAADDTTD